MGATNVIENADGIPEIVSHRSRMTFGKVTQLGTTTEYIDTGLTFCDDIYLQLQGATTQVTNIRISDLVTFPTDGSTIQILLDNGPNPDLTIRWRAFGVMD